jgi:hypothetical protein
VLAASTTDEQHGLAHTPRPDGGDLTIPFVPQTRARRAVPQLGVGKLSYTRRV